MRDLRRVARKTGRALVSVALVGLVVAFGACCAHRAQGTATGLRGTVMKGPMCPGPQRKEHPCPDLPVEAEFRVLGTEGASVATFRSDEAGRFQVALPPGEFTVVPEGHSPLRNPLGGDARVAVMEGEVTEVSLHWDTRLR